MYRFIATAAFLALAGCSHIAEQSEPAFLTAGPSGQDAFARDTQSVPDFQTAYFGDNSSTLNVDGRHAVENNAEWLKKHPDRKVVIEGHCDSRGSNAYNQELGLARAEAAKTYLIELGIAEDRISTLSRGSSNDISKHGHAQQNRRAAFKLDDNAPISAR